MLHNKHVRRGWYALTTGVLLFSIALAMPNIAAVFADTPVVQGTVTDQDGAGVANATVELHTPDGIFSTNTITNASGQYAISASLTAGTHYAVEVRLPTGYNHADSTQIDNQFVYAAGDATRTINFGLIRATKTISGFVLNAAGNPMTDADIILTPYNITGTTSTVGTHTAADGSFSATVVGGTWFAEAAVNLSDTTFTQQWISEEAPFRIDFAKDTTSETAMHNFTVTSATGKVTVQLLNSDGNRLTTSDFVADVDFRRADGVGTTRKVRSADSVVSVYLTPGIYTIAVYHNDLTGKSFDPTKTTFAMIENGNVDLGTVQAEVNGAHLKGTVTDGSGRAMNNVQIQAFRDNGIDRPSANSGSDGSFDITVGPGTWNIGLNTMDTAHTQTAPVTATVANGQTITGLKIMVKNLDRTVSGSVVNGAGTVITDYVGSAYVRNSAKTAKISAPVVNGAFSINYPSSDISGPSVIVGVEASDNSSYTGGREAKITVRNSTTVVKNVTVQPFDAVLKGTLTLEYAKTAASNTGSDIQVEAVDGSGNYTNVTVGADGTYALPLAAGTWYYDYSVLHPEDTAGLLNTPAGQNSVTITSGQTVVRNMTVREGRNTVTGTVTDSSGAAVKGAVVSIDNRASLENKADTKGAQIISTSVSTNESGVYTVRIPDGTYMISVGDTPEVASTQIAPDSRNVTVSGGTTATKNLAFETANATIKGKVTLNNKSDGYGTITAYSDNGKQATASVAKNGTYSLPVTSGDTWHIVATDLSGKNLLESEVKDVKTKKGSNTVNVTLSDTGVDVPGPVTKTFSADQNGTVSLSDGASVSIPPFAIDVTGTVSVTVSPTIDLDRTTLSAPATIAYEIKAVDSDGIEVRQLNKPAEVTVPYDQTTAEKSGLLEGRLEPTYFDPQTQTWETAGASGLVDTKNNVATISTTHLTKFSVTGTTKPLPKITNVSSKTATASTVTVEIAGKNFVGKAKVTFGSAKASRVVVKSNLLKATFTTASLKSGNQKLTVTNGNGRTASTTKSVTVKGANVTIK